MPFTNTKEEGFESLIVNWLVEQNGYELGSNEDYSKEYAIDESRLFRFLQDTQPTEVQKNGLHNDLKRRQFLARLRNEISKRGVIDVLRNGMKYYPASMDLYYLIPTEGNKSSERLYKKNVFSVTRQLRYSENSKTLALDLCIFINGLPVITMELKNSLTGQNTKDAVQQYMIDRDPKDLLFTFKRCMAHFAVDDLTIEFCTKLYKDKSWFLPFNKGYNDGAGNPPNENGIRTDYLWKDILTKEKLSLILENYAQVVIETDEETKKKTEKQVFPRYHQLDVVITLLDRVKKEGVGNRYLIQHSAGSGKSNSIAWLAYQLIELRKDGKLMFDSVIVVTDRRILDKQIRNTIKQFMQVKDTVAWAHNAGDLRKAIQDGKKIIITTVEKFPFAIEGLGQTHKDNHFAIVIDEAHSGQSGTNSAKMNLALSGLAGKGKMDDEDMINAMMEGRKLLKNASYFAFTATPKNKTLEMFGEIIYDAVGNPVLNDDGSPKRKPSHVYTMKQAIQEGFILDVLKNYTTIDSYYRIMKTCQDDPMFDRKRAQKKLRSFVEGDAYTISRKSEMMVEHFHEQVLAKRKIDGQAHAMVVTESINRCLEYYFAIQRLLEKRNSPYKALVAFSGHHKLDDTDKTVTSSDLNGFPDSKIPSNFKKDPYRILVVADMFQTGFDEPLLQSMYVDKQLYDIEAVQTLSRLNRSYPGKEDTFVLDFANKPDVIKDSFATYYKTTILSGETDPNKLYDQITIMEGYQVYSDIDVETLVTLFLNGAERDKLDPILDRCRDTYMELDKVDKAKFKKAAKVFVRTYGFLGEILPYGNVEWEKLSIFLNLLIPKLPNPDDEDLSEGILDVVDMTSYRNSARDAIAIKLDDVDAEIDPVPVSKTIHSMTPEMAYISAIVEAFNKQFWKHNWEDPDGMWDQVSKQIPEKVAQNESYQNAMKNSDEEDARMEMESALKKVMQSMMMDNFELYKAFFDDPEFRKSMLDYIFNQTYDPKKK